MAKLFWRINYFKNSMEVIKNLSLFDLKDYDVIIPVKISSQKTPSIETKMFDKKLELTFDTGFGGRLYISDAHFDSTKIKKALQTFGNSSVGAFGAGKPVPGYIFTINELTLGNKSFQNESISTANVNIIGNKFFEDFTFILDWKTVKFT